MTTQYADTICVANQAGCDIEFDIKDSDGNVVVSATKCYAIDKTECKGLGGVDTGTEVYPFIGGCGGNHVSGDKVTVTPNGGTATYTVTGVINFLKVKLQ